MALDAMIESVREDMRENDPGNHATIGALDGELKGLMAARTYVELDSVRSHVALTKGERAGYHCNSRQACSYPDCSCQPTESGNAVHSMPSTTACSGEPGRIPDLEKARINAQYWKMHAFNADDRSDAVLAMDQAANAWKNAAYAMADQRDSALSAIACRPEAVKTAESILRVHKDGGLVPTVRDVVQLSREVVRLKKALKT